MAQQVANSIKRVTLSVLLCCPLFAIAQVGGIEDRMAIAESKYEQAVKAGFAWRANRLALEAAREAFAAGDRERAAAEVEAAIKLADASLAQAARESESWSTRFPFASNDE